MLGGVLVLFSLAGLCFDGFDKQSWVLLLAFIFGLYATGDCYYKLVKYRCV